MTRTSAQTHGNTKPPRLFTGFLAAATLALAVLCLLLVNQNRSLKAELAAQAAIASAGRPEPIKPGDRVGRLTLVRRDGTVRTLDFGESQPPALVFIIGGACGYCEKVLPAWDAMLTDMGLTGETGGGQIRITAVQTDARTGADLKVLPASIPVGMADASKDTWLRHIPIEPAAVLIDPRGAVVKTWFGLPAAADTADMRATLLGSLTSERR